jgi:hypothetical protein
MKLSIYIIHLLTTIILIKHAVNGYNLFIIFLIYIIMSFLCFCLYRCITSKF